MVRLTTHRRPRAAWERALLFTVLLPALVLGTVVGGRTAWIHSHGEEAGHVHLPPEEIASGDAMVLGEWHDAQHEHEHDGDHDDHGPAPSDLLVHLPPIVVVSWRAASRPDLIGSFTIAASPVRTHEGVERRPYRPEQFRSGWPPQSGQRTGIAALLRSSHAILI